MNLQFGKYAFSAIFNAYPSFCGGSILSNFHLYLKSDCPDSKWGGYTQCESIKDGITKIYNGFTGSIFISDRASGHMQKLFDEVAPGEIVTTKERRFEFYKLPQYMNGNSGHYVQTMVIIVRAL